MQNTRGVPWSSLLAAVMAAVCLAACGSSNQSSPASSLLHRKPPPKRAPAVATADPTAEMSAAVGTSKVSSPVSVKFQMASRPEPGQPLSIDFALTPDPTVLSIGAKFEGDGAGLVLVSGAQVPDIIKPTPRVPILHTVVVQPKADGIYTLIATVTAGTDGDSKVRTFIIPVIVGKGLPALAAQSESGTKARP